MEQDTAAPQQAVVPTDDAASDNSDRPAVAPKKSWSKAEDALLRDQVRLHGAEGWEAISAAFPDRNARSCRLRWVQHLDPGLETARPFTAEEDAKVVAYQSLYPNKWSTIPAHIPGRSDNAIKNRWNSFLCKQQKRQQRQRDRTLMLFPLRCGDVQIMRRRDNDPVVQPAKDANGAEDDQQAGACLELFPRKHGDLARIDANGGAPTDVDYGAGDPLTQLRL